MAAGGYEYDFVGTLPDRIVCKICQYPSRNPYLSICCGHVFCKTCIDQMKRAKLLCVVCPMCRDEEFPTVPNKQIDREVKSLMVSCTNKEKGCSWKGKIRAVETHRKSCTMEMVWCEYYNVGCKVSVSDLLLTRFGTCNHNLPQESPINFRFSRLYMFINHSVSLNKIPSHVR